MTPKVYGGMNWYYSTDGRAQGPVGEERLAELAAGEMLDGNSLIWNPTMDEWLEVWKVRPEVLGPWEKAVRAQELRRAEMEHSIEEPEAEALTVRTPGELPRGVFSRIFGKLRKR